MVCVGRGRGWEGVFGCRYFPKGRERIEHIGS